MIRQRCLTQLFAAVIGLSLCLGSKTAWGQSQQACVTLQGNGERYPALIAQLLALLEQDIEPKVIFGGSSAAGAASLVRSVLNNPSLANVQVQVNGKELSLAEKAARIIATTPDPIATIIVLPGINRLGETLKSLVLYGVADQLVEAFVGYPEQSLANLEAAVGQISLLTEFFATADFSAALQEDDLATRSRLVMRDWLAFSEQLYVTPKEFIRALITAPDDERWTERSEEIKTRYFDLFYSDITPEDQLPEPARQRYNKMLSWLKPLINQISDERWESIFLSAIGNLQGVPFVSYTATVLSKPFYLPSGKRIVAAYKGESGFRLPDGVILHTTARQASRRWVGGLVEKEGLENFYQVYFPSRNLFSDLSSARARLGASESFLSYEDQDGNDQSLLPRSQLLVLNNQTFPQVIKYSIAEPNAFRRDALTLSPSDMMRNDFSLPAETQLVTFGGWMEHANLNTLMSLEACQNVDYLVETSTLSDGLFQFQLKAIRAVIEGGTQASWLGLFGERATENASETFVNQLWASYEYGRRLAGPDRYVGLDFDWDNASGEQAGSELGTALNAAYDRNRNAFFIRAYQYAADRLEADSFGRFPRVDAAVMGTDLRAIDLSLTKDPEQIDAVVDQILKR